MSLYFTADLHLGHANIVRYCLRPFLNPDEEQSALADPRGKWRVSPETLDRHDAALLDAINAAVQPADTLWILGDFCWGDYAAARRYRDRIACRYVNFVWGNHDKRSLRDLFGEAIEQGMVAFEGQDIWLNHYPMRSWDKSFHGSWHLYGHVHGRLAAEDARDVSRLTRDVGVDACNYRPLSFAELAAYMAPRQEAFAAWRRAAIAGEAGGPT